MEQKMNNANLKQQQQQTKEILLLEPLQQGQKIALALASSVNPPLLDHSGNSNNNVNVYAINKYAPQYLH
jgi:hypothetical protein